VSQPAAGADFGQSTDRDCFKAKNATMSDMETDSNSESEQLNKNDEGEWEDWTDDEGVNEDATRSLFDGTVHPSVDAAVQYDTKTHSFDIIQFRKQVCLAPTTWWLL
jgi:hypothetical protein